MQREQVLAFALTLPQAVADKPFEEDFDTTVLRHGAGGKWFGLIMNIPKKRVGIEEDGMVDVLNLKIDPEESYAVREMFEGIIPAYHMNKRHWISVVLNDTVPMEFCEILIQKSYDLTKKKLNNVQNRRKKI
jgi:predicted DNA-binding protein (MmcQ/YjbR family)